ncbi:NAD-dependent succinate-semialdehyde dehydrogenase [Dactylosporangium sp. CA-092794]|uniref:NAD-dependent succinate-semialdehyde dehydrogenase n=1 Tax=Dactylosporangium sp. CA-092794 TaxID=3239929 RepID=UPI003D8FA9CF
MTAYRVVDPATNELVREYPTATDSEVQDGLTRAYTAFRSWRTTPLPQRSRLLHRVAELYAERLDDLAAIVTREMGKPTREARGELKLVMSIYRYYADNAEQFLADTPLSPRMGGTAVVRKDPIGPLLGIMPWNYPHYQVARFVAPNLMAGNPVIVKHAPQCPESALGIEALLRDAGAPDGVYVNLFATNQQVADVIADPRVLGVSVTGSERAGSAVAEVAGRHLKKCVLELGGSDPFIVLDSADVAKSVKAAVTGRMANAGQMCNASKRIIVVEALYDAFVEQFSAAMSALRPGDPTDPESGFGPLSSEDAARRLVEQIEEAVAKGAKLRTGGRRADRPGAYVEATVLTDVTPDMRAYHEELFGPAAVVYRVADADAAVELANSSPYGLGGVVFGADQAAAEAVADRLDTGMVWINSPQGSAADLPFGGTKRSGTGRELGALGIEEFVNKKLIYTPKPR